MRANTRQIVLPQTFVPLLTGLFSCKCKKITIITKKMIFGVEVKALHT